MKKIIIVLIAALIILLLSAVIIRFNQDLIDPCRQKVKGNGICEAYLEGYEFDNSLAKCVKVSVSGCSFEAPFKTIDKCHNICEN